MMRKEKRRGRSDEITSHGMLISIPIFFTSFFTALAYIYKDRGVQHASYIRNCIKHSENDLSVYYYYIYIIQQHDSSRRHLHTAVNHTILSQVQLKHKMYVFEFFSKKQYNVHIKLDYWC